MSLPEISVQELQALKQSGEEIFILDVRDQPEFDEYNLGGYLIPLKDLPTRITELDRSDLIIVHCQMGGRSSRATAYLLEQGFNNVKNLRGGAKAWQAEIDKK